MMGRKPTKEPLDNRDPIEKPTECHWYDNTKEKPIYEPFPKIRELVLPKSPIYLVKGDYGVFLSYWLDGEWWTGPVYQLSIVNVAKWWMKVPDPPIDKQPLPR